MEKCTFCVQRIREAETARKLEGRELVADEFTVGLRAGLSVARDHLRRRGGPAAGRWRSSVDDRRAYHVFEELNTYTAVVYLKKVNHPAPGAPATA